jgi:hypothetical protein
MIGQSKFEIKMTSEPSNNIKMKKNQEIINLNISLLAEKERKIKILIQTLKECMKKKEFENLMNQLSNIKNYFKYFLFLF